jgi:hypothetical protein
VNLNEDSDALIWVYEKSGTYSSHSFYVVISYRGVTPMYIPSIWNIKVPPKIQLFLWLLSHNKLVTVDNLNRKGMSKPEECCFCNEKETIKHLFFECVVAKTIWRYTSEFVGWEIGVDYFSVASKWIHKEKFYSANVISYAVLKAIWLTRNDFVFNKQDWRDVKGVLRKILKLSLEWKILGKEQNMEMMMSWCSFLEKLIREPWCFDERGC